MKPLAAVLSSLMLALTGMPFLLGTGMPDDRNCLPSAQAAEDEAGASAETAAVLATIRQRESGGDYRARASGSTASGAYQFIRTTWANYEGYAEAWLAPPEIQDAKATQHVQGILDTHGGKVEAVPVVWYIGWYPSPGDPAWDAVPYEGAGNVLTPRQYRDEWMSTYRDNLRGQGASPEPSATAGCEAADVMSQRDGWAQPADPELFTAAPVDAPHHDYPAWDWAIPTGTPIYAIRGGDVVDAHRWPDNCFGTSTACQPCGTGVTIEDRDRVRWIYCHGSELHVQQGDVVAAGQQILSSGNTGRSTGPHLHLSVQTSDGQARCPQPLLQALRDGRVPMSPVHLPRRGCTN